MFRSRRPHEERGRGNESISLRPKICVRAELLRRECNCRSHLNSMSVKRRREINGDRDGAEIRWSLAGFSGPYIGLVGLYTGLLGLYVAGSSEYTGLPGLSVIWWRPSLVRLTFDLCARGKELDHTHLRFFMKFNRLTRHPFHDDVSTSCVEHPFSIRYVWQAFKKVQCRPTLNPIDIIHHYLRAHVCRLILLEIHACVDREERL